MRRLTAWVGLGCGLVLLLFFYRTVLFQGEQFGFRDSAHYYYPLYHKVQAEWNAGRWPLWDTSENAGMPLLGNPTAAVLYPGKVIFAVLPYAWGARLYTVFHTVLAFLGMIALLRSWGTSWVGSMIAGLSYAFGGPVVFQNCNIIFLVGAAWIPWGMLAIDRWVRLKRPWSLAMLAVVLAMQVLGGDPESAYLLGLCAGGYAVGLTWVGRFGPWRFRPSRWVPLVGLTLLAWTVIMLVLAVYLPGFRPEPKEGIWGAFGRWLSTGKIPVFRKGMFEGPVSSLPWTAWLPRVVAGAWGLAGILLVYQWWRRGASNRPLVPLLAGLAMSAALAGGLSAAQMVPAVEFTSLTSRATDESGHDMYPFSLEPYRLIEAFVPGVFGRRFGLRVMWSDLILSRLSHRIWVPSLYFGGLTAVLALSALGFRGGPPWRGWLTGIAAVSLIGSFGEFSSPLLFGRFVPSVAKDLGFELSVPSFFNDLGPLDLKQTNAVRLDGYLRNGDGSPYFLMSELLPGFSQFRFPSKLLTFTLLAMAALGGIGWDRAIQGRSRRIVWFTMVGSGLSWISLVVVVAAHVWITQQFENHRQLSITGPLDIPEALFDLKLGLLQAAVVLASIAGLVVLARRRPDVAGLLALLLLTADLGSTNPYLVQTVPQSEFEVTPKVVKLIEEAERLDPSPGPYRVHRMPLWNPLSWQSTPSQERVLDFVRWEHDTIQPKYGLLHGVEYTQTIGVAELYDHSWFFAPFPRAARAETAASLGINKGDEVVVYPRRGFDLWNSRYFVLPAVPRFSEVDRGIAVFLPQTEMIYPSPTILKGDLKDPKVKHWLEEEDFRILRNKTAFPRSWIVHDAVFHKPILGLTRETRRALMEEILYPNDAFWSGPLWTYRDPKKVAWIEAEEEDWPRLKKSLSANPPSSDESVKFINDESNPQRVVLEANLKSPGLVVLADIFYPGWKLTIDGQPASILKTNRAMRGAAVGAGLHRLVYTYEPRSFRLGAAISLTSIVALVGFSVWSLRRMG